MSAEKKRMPLHTKIFLGLLVGAIAGGITQYTIGADNATLQAFVKNIAQPVGQIFLRLIFMIVVPLLFSALVLGVAEIGDVRRVGRVGARALLMTLLLSTTAVGLGLFMVNTFKPGVGIDAQKREQLVATYAQKEDAAKKVGQAREAKSGADAILEIIPTNPLQEAVRALEGGLLPFMFFALVFGIALATVEAEKTQVVKAFLEGVFAISLRVIDFAMAFAPIGVAALVFSTAALLGIDAILALGKYFVLVLVTLAIHQFVTYSLALKFIARRNPFQFFKQIESVMLTAFATSSSNATLPTSLRVSQEEVGLPRDISSFVLTVGATANQNGTALFEGITILFLAQFFGIPLSLGQQMLIMLLAILAGVGTAGVPGGSWPMIAVILMKVGIPPESIGIVLGIDRILDMSRTVLNVTGDITIAACVSTLDGEREEIPAEAYG